jgi:hypothetical protein
MIHDFRNPVWGHNVEIMDIPGGSGYTLKVAGWCHGVSVGDYLVLPDGPDWARYQVDEIRYQRNPRDMFFATLSWTQFSSQEELDEFESSIPTRRQA